VLLDRDEGLRNVTSAADLTVIAVAMPNDPGIRNVPWRTYETTVDAVEALSGYDLLALLPDATINRAFALAPSRSPFATISVSWRANSSSLNLLDPTAVVFG